MYASSVQSSEYLPTINSSVETARLAYGAMIRLCISSAAFYGTRGLISEVVLRRKFALDDAERESVCYVASMAVEAGVSLLWAPVRYLAAVNTPRFLLDYMLTSGSELLRYIDNFNPGNFASYALYGFTPNIDSDWNFDFFGWQVPSLILSVGKLMWRRRRLGTEQCRTKRVLGMLVCQVFVRAYMATISVMVPESTGEAVGSMVVIGLEGLCTAYLARQTWPFAEVKPTRAPKKPAAGAAVAVDSSTATSNAFVRPVPAAAAVTWKTDVLD